jgi:hypothetical protein
MDRITFSAPVFRVFTDAIILLLVVLSTRSILHFMPNAPVHLAQGVPETSKYRDLSLTQKV